MESGAELTEIPKSDQALIISYIARMHDWKENSDKYPSFPRIGKL